MIQAIRGALGGQLDLPWYMALCDSPEEAQAMHAMHSAQSAANRRN